MMRKEIHLYKGKKENIFEVVVMFVKHQKCPRETCQIQSKPTQSIESYSVRQNNAFTSSFLALQK